jgi:hypothetical protein
MAALDGVGVLAVRFENVPGRTDQKISTWLLKLQSASDTLVVPTLEYTTTGSVKAWDSADLAGSISATAAAADEGANTVTITGGARDTLVVLSCMHRRGVANNMSIDEDP